MKTVRFELSYAFIYRMLAAFVLISIIGFTAFRIANAYTSEVQAANHQEISFKSVRISSNDTLWSIAKENYSAEYGTLEEYIQEIMRCNSLTSADIHAGSSIIVPIYLPEKSIDYLH